MSEATGTPRLNRLWAGLLVEELVRCGVDFFCVAPGSRSTPLVAAIAENPRARSRIHYDERGTSFAALGYARATGKPAAWVTTSGTAVANGRPAVAEAATDNVPMLLLTADRPPELRQTGANQTIVQPGIFGEYVRWSFDMPAPDAAIDPAMVLTTADQAVHRTLRAPRGPVHLNLMFREPFLSEPGLETEDELPAHLAGWRESEGPYTRYAATKPAMDEAEAGRLWSDLRRVERGIVVAGRLTSREQGEAALGLAEALGWPLLPDIGSQVRLGARSENLAAHYDLLLGSERFAEAHMPEAALHLGGPSVSKRLQQFLSRRHPRLHAVVREDPSRLDPNHRTTHRIEADVVDFCASLTASERRTSPSSWTASWRDASEKAGGYLERRFSESGELTEPIVARLVSRHIPDGHGLVVASSMPIRDMDAFAASDGAAIPVAANRGASGIDGTVATAAGFAHGLQSPVTLLIGDLALLHDLNSLAMLRDLPAVIVVLNNNGGGIFEFLPVSQHKEFFEPYFGTPQDVSFEHAAAMFGLAYAHPHTVAEFTESHEAALARNTPTLIEVQTDRGENTELHRNILREVSGAVS